MATTTVAVGSPRCNDRADDALEWPASPKRSASPSSRADAYGSPMSAPSAGSCPRVGAPRRGTDVLVAEGGFSRTMSALSDAAPRLGRPGAR